MNVYERQIWATKVIGWCALGIAICIAYALVCKWLGVAP